MTYTLNVAFRGGEDGGEKGGMSLKEIGDELSLFLMVGGGGGGGGDEERSRKVGGVWKLGEQLGDSM